MALSRTAAADPGRRSAYSRQDHHIRARAGIVLLTQSRDAGAMRPASGLSCPPPRRRGVMQDTTVSGIGFASDSGAKPRRRFFSLAVRHGHHDELLAGVLISSWSLATGRTPRGVPPQSLTEDEL